MDTASRTMGLDFQIQWAPFFLDPRLPGGEMQTFHVHGNAGCSSLLSVDDQRERQRNAEADGVGMPPGDGNHPVCAAGLEQEVEREFQ